MKYQHSKHIKIINKLQNFIIPQTSLIYETSAEECDGNSVGKDVRIQYD